jgi:hypothetical protein
MNEKLKSLLLNDQIFYGCVVILVALASFGLGRASVVEISTITPEKVVVTEVGRTAPALLPVSAPKAVSVPVLEPASSGTLVASKSGTKYHLLTCPGAKQIKEENKIYFASVTEAEAAGYKPAANCPQLQ